MKVFGSILNPLLCTNNFINLWHISANLVKSKDYYWILSETSNFCCLFIWVIERVEEIENESWFLRTFYKHVKSDRTHCYKITGKN